jgi:hypothetical protein
MTEKAREFAIETWGEDWTPNEWGSLVEFADIYHAKILTALTDIIALSKDFPDGAPDHEFDNGYIAGVLAATEIAKAAIDIAPLSSKKIEI